MKPLESEYPKFFGTYIQPVTNDDLIDELRRVKKMVLDLVVTVKQQQENHAYAEGKWTLKQVLLHCIDTERVFAYRAMCFARGEKQKMLAFDENVYADHSDAHLRPLASIAAEFAAVRDASILLFESFSKEKLAGTGEMQSGTITVNALGYAICGHTQHHLNVIKERYLK